MTSDWVDEHPGDQEKVPAPADAAEQTTDLMEELGRVRAERDAAVQALDRRGRRERRSRKARRAVVGVLVVVFCVLLPLAFTISWAHYTVLNTNGWVDNVGPLSSNPAVAGAVATTVTDQVFTALDAEQQIKGALPPRASFLAGPITNGIRGYVQQAVTTVVGSPEFHTIWVGANRFAHTQLVKVLEGNTKALHTTNGQVVLDLVPLVNAALAQIEPLVSGIAGKPVDLPTISPNDIPANACQKIGSAIGRPLPPNCGQIPLFPADKLTQAQRLVRVFNRVMVLLLVLTPIIFGLALWLSRRRRRTLLQMGVGGILGLVVFRRVVIGLEHNLVNSGDPANKAARQAILSQVFHLYFDISTWLLVGLAVVVVIAAVSGPYRWARAIRRQPARLGHVGAALVVNTTGRARDEATLAWMRSHLDLLRVAGIVLAVILLLVLPVSWIGVIVIAALLALYELWLQRFRPRTPSAPDTPPG